jgi:hypothetical protein
MSLRSLTKIAGSGSISQRYGSADPDPYQNLMDPQNGLQLLKKNAGCCTGTWLLTLRRNSCVS